MSLKILDFSSPAATLLSIPTYPFTLQVRARISNVDNVAPKIEFSAGGAAHLGFDWAFQGLANMVRMDHYNDDSNRISIGSDVANSVVADTWQVFTATVTSETSFALFIGTVGQGTIYHNLGTRSSFLPLTQVVLSGNTAGVVEFRDLAVWSGLHTTQNIIDAVTNNYAPNLVRAGSLLHSWDFNSARSGVTAVVGARDVVLNGATLNAIDGLTTVVYALGGDVTPPTLSATAPTQTAATTTSVTVSLPAGSDNVGVTAAQFQINASTEWQTIGLTGGVITQVQAGSPFVAATGYSFRYRISDAAGNFSATSANTTVTTASAAVALFGRGTFPVAVSPLGTLPAVATVYQMGCSPGWPGTAGAPATVTTTRVAVTVQPTGAFAFPAPFGSVIDTVYTLYGGEWDGVGTTPTGDAVCWSGRYVT